MTQDISQLLGVLVPLADAAIATVAGIGLVALKKHLGISQTSVLNGDFDKLLAEGVALAEHEVGVIADHNMSVQTANSLVERVLAYANAVGPGLIQGLGLTPATLEQSVRAAVAQKVAASSSTTGEKS